MGAETVGRFEMEVLFATWQLREQGYGVSIADQLEVRTGERPTVGKLYSTLDRLTQKGFLEDRMGEPTAERGGRRKRFFRITGEGQRVAGTSFNRLAALADGLPLGGQHGAVA